MHHKVILTRRLLLLVALGNVVVIVIAKIAEIATGVPVGVGVS